MQRLDSGQRAEAEKAVVRVQAIARGHLRRDALQEERRLEWFGYYCREGEHAKALELAVTQQEIDQVHRLQDAASLTSKLRDAPCLAPGAADGADGGDGGGNDTRNPPSPAEAPFVTAIKEYNWSAAEILASSEAERADLRDSKSRVQWMGHLCDRGEHDKALELAITKAEQAQISQAQIEASRKGRKQAN